MNNTMKKRLTYILIGLILPCIVLVKCAQFMQDCKGYLEQCSNANSVEMALNRLELAIRYLERNDMTTGYTSILWKTEDENIGFWYENLQTCRQELIKARDASQLEQTNVLMRVRESLVKNGEKGESLIIPDGIVKYPHNLGYAIGLWLSLFLLVIGVCKFNF